MNGNTVQKEKLLALVTQEKYTEAIFVINHQRSHLQLAILLYVNLIYQSTSFNVISVNFSYKNFLSSALAQCHSIYQHLDLIVPHESQPALECLHLHSWLLNSMITIPNTRFTEIDCLKLLCYRNENKTFLRSLLLTNKLQTHCWL